MATGQTKVYKVGMTPSSRHALANAIPHHTLQAALPAPAKFLMWPSKMDVWGNDQFVDCVTAEEAFAKATAAPKVFLSDKIIEGWAKEHGVLGGGILHDVLVAMEKSGFKTSDAIYNNGPAHTVDWKNPERLHQAISSSGPVKIGVAAAQFLLKDRGIYGVVTGEESGWAMYQLRQDEDYDHCVSLCGYGHIEFPRDCARPTELLKPCCAEEG